MATGKRYYWLKLKESFMTSDTIDYFMSQPDGANYVVLYQMLCLKTINTEGRLSRKIGEVIIPYDISKIQRDLKWFSADTIRVALNLYKAFGLLYEDVDGVLRMTDHDNLVGSETDYAEKNRRMRAKEQKELTGHIGSTNVSTDIEIRDRDKRVEIDTRDKKLDSREERESKERKPPAYGEYHNVFLSDEDVEKLKAEFPDWQERIERLSEYIASTGKKYKSHLATIRSWARKDKKEKAKTNSPLDDLAEIHRMFEAEERGEQ